MTKRHAHRNKLTAPKPKPDNPHLDHVYDVKFGLVRIKGVKGVRTT